MSGYGENLHESLDFSEDYDYHGFSIADMGWTTQYEKSLVPKCDKIRKLQFKYGRESRVSSAWSPYKTREA